MILHAGDLRREKWEEWFVFFLSDRYEVKAKEFLKLLGWQRFFYVRFYAWNMAGYWYLLWPLALFVYLREWWYSVAHWCYRKKLFRTLPEEGQRMDCFWPRYFL